MSPSERRLEALRDEAARTGGVRGVGVRAAGGPAPSALAERAGYYGRALLKPPVWTWEIPAYFFVGGLAGGSAVIAWAALLFGPGPGGLVRVALGLALAGTALSAALLIMDLGRPSRFLNMLRVFKWRSPMSVGVWVLTGFGASVALGVAGAELGARGWAPWLATALLGVGAWAGALLGSLVATYTGVLIGATAVPAWNVHRALLPAHFGVAGLGSAGAALELAGFDVAALWWLGLMAAAMETSLALAVELSLKGAADRALHEGRAANLVRGAAALMGPASLVLRLLAPTPWAGAAFLLGAFASRFAWLEVGRESASDPEAALERYGA